MNTSAISQRLLTIQAVTYSAIGVDISDSSKFNSPIQFDAYDHWLGEDFDFIINSIMDEFFGEIEEDLLSVWSTNKSE